VQELIDIRNQLDRYASPQTVEWHFASINNRWTKRSLAVAGFGLPSPPNDSGAPHHVKPIFSVAETGGADSAARAAEIEELVSFRSAHPGAADVEAGISPEAKREAKKLASVHGLNRPLFHVDLTSALQSALIRSRIREERYAQLREVEGAGSQTSDQPVKLE
jgi:solute carrier family 26 (sodium-independent sulfate anion transporter), member 11